MATLSARILTTLLDWYPVRKRPGLAVQPFHSEIFAPATEASGAALALALMHELDHNGLAGLLEPLRRVKENP